MARSSEGPRYYEKIHLWEYVRGARLNPGRKKAPRKDKYDGRIEKFEVDVEETGTDVDRLTERENQQETTEA